MTQSSGQSVGGFGEAVAISGDTIVVGGLDATIGQGAAYIYINPSGNATPAAELTVSGGKTVSTVSGVAIDGDTVVVGNALVSIGSNEEEGSAYVYVKPSGGWANMTQTAQLLATDGASGSEFGTSVSMSGRNVVVGAPAATSGGVSKRGLAYLFVEPSVGWSGIRGQATEFEASDATRQAAFGVSVSVSGSTVAVGAPNETVNSNQAQGAVYVFVRPPTGWPKTMTETAELTANLAKSGDKFGISVTLSGKTLLAGAFLRDYGRGAAYLFAEPSNGWQTASSGGVITASDGTANNYFGAPVAIGDGVLAVCASGWPSGGLEADGAVYLFGKSQ